MENSSSLEEYKLTIQFLLCAVRSSGKHWYFFSAIYVLLTITTTLGNTLILIALHKDSSLHPPSKLLYRCLAMTDLLVGVILQPSNALHNALLVKGHPSTVVKDAHRGGSQSDCRKKSRDGLSTNQIAGFGGVVIQDGRSKNGVTKSVTWGVTRSQIRK